MASVFELGEPYRNHLVPVLPPGSGVCAVCWTAVSPGFRLCYRCNKANGSFGQGLADVVVPVALAVKREQLAHELWHYKYDVDSHVRSRLTTRLGAVLWRFLGQHEMHIADAAGVREFDIVTTVPGTRPREGAHPLEYIVGTLVGQTKGRYEPLLAPGRGSPAAKHSLAADRYAATRPLLNGSAVLLVDDTWTTGGNAQSAALALRVAGAGKVAIVVIGRHFDRALRGLRDLLPAGPIDQFHLGLLLLGVQPRQVSCGTTRKVAGAGRSGLAWRRRFRFR